MSMDIQVNGLEDKTLITTIMTMRENIFVKVDIMIVTAVKCVKFS